MSRIILTAASRVGCVRSNNEDMVLAYDKFVRSDAHQTEFMTENIDRFVIALADGMGGHQAGEVASEETLSNLKFFIDDLPLGLASGEFHEMMMEWLKSINQIINSRGLETSRDSIVYSSSLSDLRSNVQDMISRYNKQREEFHSVKNKVKDLLSFIHDEDA